MTEATLITGGARPAVRLERLLPDPPEVVWRAITEPEQLKGWFPCDVIVADGGWEPGATIRFEFPGLAMDGAVLEADEPRRLAFTWGEEILRFELRAEGDGTRLVLTDELPGSIAARNAAGWDGCLDRLAGLSGGPWRARFDRYTAVFEPELGPQDGPPAGYQG